MTNRVQMGLVMRSQRYFNVQPVSTTQPLLHNGSPAERQPPDECLDKQPGALYEREPRGCRSPFTSSLWGVPH